MMPDGEIAVLELLDRGVRVDDTEVRYQRGKCPELGEIDRDLDALTRDDLVMCVISWELTADGRALIAAHRHENGTPVPDRVLRVPRRAVGEQLILDGFAVFDRVHAARAGRPRRAA